MLIPHSSAPFDVFEVFHIELQLLPERAGIPAVEIAHIEEHTQLSVLLHEALELRNTVLVIGGYEFPANVNEANLAPVFLIDLNSLLY